MLTNHRILLFAALFFHRVQPINLVGGTAGHERQAPREVWFLYLTHGPYIGILTTPNYDIVQLRSMVPFDVSQPLLVDTA